MTRARAIDPGPRQRGWSGPHSGGQDPGDQVVVGQGSSADSPGAVAGVEDVDPGVLVPMPRHDQRTDDVGGGGYERGSPVRVGPAEVLPLQVPEDQRPVGTARTDPPV